jgi:uncharacterized protein YjbI with pentapeptide repeats
LQWPLSVHCERLIHRKFDYLDLRFDRLNLSRVDVVDDEKLEKIEKATSKSGEEPYQGERTRLLRDRNFNCGDFSQYVDLRRVDLSGSHLQFADLVNAKLGGANLTDARLRGASLIGAQLQGASLDRAQLRGALLIRAQLPGASLIDAQLQDTSLVDAQLQGASLSGAQLQGASLVNTQLQGALLDRAQMQGANIIGARLQAASLRGAQLQGSHVVATRLDGATLAGSRLQGASLAGSRLQGASLGGAQLQGVSLVATQLQGASLVGVYVWRAKDAECKEARVGYPNSEAIIDIISTPRRPDEKIRATPDEIAKFIERAVVDIPDEKQKERVRALMRSGLVDDPAKDDTAIEAVWKECKNESAKHSLQSFEETRRQLLRDLVCNDQENGKAIARGVIRNWISDNSPDARAFSSRLAPGLLGEDGRECVELDQSSKDRLRWFVPLSGAKGATKQK